MKLKTTKGLFYEGVENLIKNKVTSMVSIITIFISLSLFSLFYISTNIISVNIINIKDNIEIVAFLNDDINKESIIKIEEKIRSINKVESIEYVSAEDGLKQYNQELQEEGEAELVKIVNETVDDNRNPIPASFTIKTINSNENESIKQILLEFDEIYKVNDSNDILNFFNNINRYLKIASNISMIILAIVSMILISNSIKVAVFTRKREISIIKYIGATKNYVRLPFIFEGFLIGAIGSILTLISTTIIYNMSVDKITDVGKGILESFVITNFGELMIFLVPLVLILGIGIGVIGSFVSIKKYLVA